jgi:hypothetical protein
MGQDCVGRRSQDDRLEVLGLDLGTENQRDDLGVRHAAQHVCLHIHSCFLLKND